MYRITTDFHCGWYNWGGLQQNIFTAGNFSALSLGDNQQGNGSCGGQTLESACFRVTNT